MKKHSWHQWDWMWIWLMTVGQPQSSMVSPSCGSTNLGGANHHGQNQWLALYHLNIFPYIYSSIYIVRYFCKYRWTATLNGFTILTWWCQSSWSECSSLFDQDDLILPHNINNRPMCSFYSDSLLVSSGCSPTQSFSREVPVKNCNPKSVHIPTQVTFIFISN